MGRKSRTRMHLVQPDTNETVLRKQGKECDSHTSSTDYTFYAGDAVWVMNFAGTRKWQGTGRANRASVTHSETG